MTVKLLTDHHLEFLSLKGGCADSSESTLVKMPHCWKSHVTAVSQEGPLHIMQWTLLTNCTNFYGNSSLVYQRGKGLLI